MTRLTLTIAWHEYLTNVRRPGFIFATLLIPALGLIGLIVATFFSGQATNFLRDQFVPQDQNPIGVVDASGLYVPIAPKFAERFTAFTDAESARQALLDRQIDGYLVIPADYLTDGKIDVFTREGGGFSNAIAVDSDEIDPFLVEGLLSGKVEGEVLTRVSDPSDFNRVTLTEAGDPDSGESNPLAFVGGFLASFAVSLVLFISIFTSASYLLRSVSEEKENRVMEVVLSSVSAADLLAGKVIGLGALGLTQVGVWLLSGVALTGGLGALAVGALAALNPMTFLLALVYFLLGYLLFGTLMAVAGSLGTSMRESQQIAGVFSFAAAVPWMLNGLVIANPNNMLVRVLSWFPLTAPMMMMLRLPYGEVPFIDIIGSIALLIVTVPIVVWGGSKVFRTSLLIYGKRLSFKEIWSALRKA
ncbi:MAG: ABC transporter permease [Anaerolineales bacterium]